MSSALGTHLRPRLARALANFNPQGAHNVLDEIFGSLPIEVALSEVIVPYLHALEPTSRRTAATIAHIQFATSLLEMRLLALASGWGTGGNPTAVISYPGPEQHTFASVAFGLALRDRGWRIVYLGASTPVHSAGEAAEATSADIAVFVSRDPETLASVRESLGRLGARRRIAVAGEGATSALARRVRAELLPRDPVAAAIDLDQRTADRLAPAVAPPLPPPPSGRHGVRPA